MIILIPVGSLLLCMESMKQSTQLSVQIPSYYKYTVHYYSTTHNQCTQLNIRAGPTFAVLDWTIPPIYIY